MNHYVIIGNGVAGATAAEKVRSNDPEGTITIFSAEKEFFYYRVRLPEVISGQVDPEKIVIHPSQWYKDKDIRLLSGEKAVEVDPNNQEVKGDQGHSVPYDRLLLATGADCFIPPVTGAEKVGVFALRNLEDAWRISDRASGAKHAVLVGGGLLGLEAGHALTRLGLNVQVVEFFDRLLPRQMDNEGAAKLQSILEKMGFTFFLGSRAKEVLGNGEAEGLMLEDGRELPGQLVLFSAGIRPNLSLAQSLGLETDKGVIVNDRLRTSRENIWAAGDLIQHRDRMYGLWPAARDQGETAGLNMAGGQVDYQGTTISNILKVAGVDLASAGEIDPEGRYMASVFQDDSSYRKIVLDGNRIIGYIFFGLKSGLRECGQAMERGLDVGPYVQEMKNRDFDFKRLVT